MNLHDRQHWARTSSPQGTARLTLCYLAYHADEQDEIAVTLNQLAVALAATPDAVEDALYWLVSHKLVQVIMPVSPMLGWLALNVGAEPSDGIGGDDQEQVLRAVLRLLSTGVEL